MSARARRSQAQMLADIHAAALAELTEVGIGRMSMAGIAQRSGTARTSLHRRWSSPTEILLEAVEDNYPQETVSPGLDDLRGDLIRALGFLADWVTTPTALAVEAILMERGRHPELAQALYERVFDRNGGRFTRTVLLHYAEHGHLDPALVTDVVTDIGEALVLKHLADNGSPPDSSLLARIVDEAVLPAVGRPLVVDREP
ncbi:TetR-like C-terminal domain-containing protein [Actinoalloteichus hymeniacidonis]|uniref:Transcriptional regulator, TetR family n=1 Tax=Actinoalloteichus hymeniacidonis TaxID=340345 RepID=A0AAC9HS21_9PSEU|nr:TetR-like C-terminal domain-containing protein [Actinoalloteichus hymeniacidonis]AOS64534.1 transcriptional regulator, TetR family [Actinoalloteichus hymeniacidonis]MBB5907394.1 AcrR family transcriptional regulator [Actinoalloteichus hymeniacidonis]